MSPKNPRRRAKQVGIAGAAIGVVAAGLATAFAVERTLVRRSVNAPGDPYVDEQFDSPPFDAEITVTAADGTNLHVEVVEPKAPTTKPTGASPARSGAIARAPSANAGAGRWRSWVVMSRP